MITRSGMGGCGVYRGLDQESRAYCEGWTVGHDDGSARQAKDMALAAGEGARARGYRDGYAIARPPRVEPDDEAKTLIGVGA